MSMEPFTEFENDDCRVRDLPKNVSNHRHHGRGPGVPQARCKPSLRLGEHLDKPLVQHWRESKSVSTSCPQAREKVSGTDLIRTLLFHKVSLDGPPEQISLR